MSTVVVPKRLVEISLVNVANQVPQLFCEDGEREYHERLQRAAKRIIRSGAHIIMLTGPSASGKTTTSHKLAAELRAQGVPAKVISLDNFLLVSEHYPVLPDGTKDYESPATLDMPLINQCLNELYTTGRSDLPVYDFANERRADYTEHMELEGGVCIVEGIHALNPELTRILPKGEVYRIYAGLREEYSSDGVRAINTRDIRLCRRLLRDAVNRGHGPEQTLEMWHKVLDGDDKYIRPYKDDADLILDTSHTYELGIIAGLVADAEKLVDPGYHKAKLWYDTIRRFDEVTKLPKSLIPADSMLCEFYGKP
ncbi:MAG: nucleoside kinase [Faecalibacterium sp.]|nr:nucleoside kinase [Faecalibacterium sp.]